MNVVCWKKWAGGRLLAPQIKLIFIPLISSAGHSAARQQFKNCFLLSAPFHSSIPLAFTIQFQLIPLISIEFFISFHFVISLIHKSFNYIHSPIAFLFALFPLAEPLPLAAAITHQRKGRESNWFMNFIGGLTALIPQLKIKIIFILNWNGSLLHLSSIENQINLIFILRKGRHCPQQTKTIQFIHSQRMNWNCFLCCWWTAA